MEESKSVISQIKKTAEGEKIMLVVVGRMITTLQEDRYVSQEVKKIRNDTPSQTAADLAISTGTHFSSKTI